MARQQFDVTEPSDDTCGDDSSKNSTNSRRPDNTAFKQQRLSAWQPVLSPKSVLPLFFLVGLIFIPLGVVFLIESNAVFEAVQEYTHCVGADNKDCSTYTVSNECNCTVSFNITKDVPGPLYVYYGLSNFYQNHRRYVKSRDDNQLIGSVVDANSLSGDCEPYKVDEDNNPIAPCGAIANSLFNDTFTLQYQNGSEVSVARTGIAWPSDHNVKFNNPPGDTVADAFAGFVKPFNWNQTVQELDPSNPDNNGYKNEAFQVWMRTAAFPTFRKLYGRIEGGLAAGDYDVKISYNFPVVAFDGQKRVILSTVSWLGGKNTFIGIAYIVVGSVSFLTGLILLVLNVVKRNKK